MVKATYFTTWAIKGDHAIVVCLTPDDPTFEHGHNERHDEGWSSCHERFTLTSEGVECERYTDGSDCDGRMSTEAHYFCPFGKLAAIVPYDFRDNPDAAPFRTPDWAEVRKGQRDYSAEAMGY